MRELLAEVCAALERGRPCVYCAVVETRGSTPQKPGAAMLVFPDGGQVGTLGGGCVEAEVKQRALQALSVGDGRAQVRTFHLDDIHGWDDGLICGGRMTILLHPLPAGTTGATAAYYRGLGELAEVGRGFTEAVVVGERAGDRYLFDGDGVLAAFLAERPAPEAVAAQLSPLAERPRPATRQGVAYLPILPRVVLFLVGGGHVGQATARLAAEVGFEIWVLDDREQYITPERFPAASRRLAGEIGPTLADLAPSLAPNVYALILTRGHRHDEEALFRLASSRCGYVGMIGSKRKIKLIFDDLIARGVAAEALARVHAPLGLEIGSQTVPEIAVSITAELIAHRNLGPSATPRPPG
ncbi:MAG TPA: XdhC family protein [Gemmataceae bacterium]|nr:XdhC family protein [Gemmataceae bacterium]